MTLKDFARDEKIVSHCGVLAETIVSIRKIYIRAQKQQRAFLETMIGAALWYTPKPRHAWTGCISVEALKSFHASSDVPNPKFSEEHMYPRKVAA